MFTCYVYTDTSHSGTGQGSYTHRQKSAPALPVTPASELTYDTRIEELLSRARWCNTPRAQYTCHRYAPVCMCVLHNIILLLIYFAQRDGFLGECQIYSSFFFFCICVYSQLKPGEKGSFTFSARERDGNKPSRGLFRLAKIFQFMCVTVKIPLETGNGTIPKIILRVTRELYV